MFSRSETRSGTPELFKSKHRSNQYLKENGIKNSGVGRFILVSDFIKFRLESITLALKEREIFKVK